MDGNKMKKKRLIIKCFIIFILLIISILPLNIQAANSKQFKSFIDKTLVEKYGRLQPGTSSYYSREYESVFHRKGVLSIYVTDLNNDKKKECLAIYVKENQLYSTYKEIHLVFYMDTNGKIRKKQDINIGSVGGGCTAYDNRIFIKTLKGKKYIVVQTQTSLNGHSNTFYILNMGKKGKIKWNMVLSDPGYTSGTGLYKKLPGYYGSKLPSNWINHKVVLYESEKDNQIKEEQYVSKLKTELQKYGLSVTFRKNYWGNQHWILKENSKMKSICRIQAKIKSGALDTYKKHTTVAINNTKF